MIDPLTILLGGVGIMVLGETVLSPMAKRVERIEAHEELRRRLEKAGLSSLVASPLPMADDASALEYFEKEIYGARPTDVHKWPTIVDGTFAQRRGGAIMEKMARDSGCVCPECARPIYEGKTAAHGIEQMLGVNLSEK